MVKNFKIVNQAGKGVVSITGYIGWWKTSGDTFTDIVNQLINAGVRDIDVYINSPGGSCFDANEIANQLKRFPGQKNGFLGALCCSAATTIASELDYVEAAKNCQYMIHDVHMELSIDHEDDFDSNKKLYQNLSKNAVNVYARKTKLPSEELARMMRLTTWMDAEEAKAKGFIDSIAGEDSEIPEGTQEAFAKLNYKGLPASLLNLSQTSKKQKESMDKIALKLGLPADATEEQILAKIAENENKSQITNTESGIRLLVQMAVKKGFKQENVEKLAKADFDTTVEMVLSAPEKETQTQQPDNVRLSDILDKLNQSGGSNTADAGRKSWTLLDWEKKDSDGLMNMIKTNPKLYQSLYKAETGVEVSLETIKELAK